MSPQRLLLLNVCCLFLWFGSHLFFLQADADLNASPGSRGAWTDEGFYTGQIRTYINHQQFNIIECDAFLKTPLLSAYLYTPFKLFDTHLITARLALLCLITAILITLLITIPVFRQVFPALSCSTLLLFPVHQYTHLSLAELNSILFLLASGCVFINYCSTKKYSLLIYCHLLLFISILFKVQFIYTLAIPSLGILMQQGLKAGKSLAYSLLYSSIIAGVLIAIGFIFFKHEYALILKQQAGQPTYNGISYALIDRNTTRYFFNDEYRFLSYCFFGLLLFISWEYTKKTINNSLRYLLLFSFCWILIEFHKLPMVYLPMRYMVSFYFAIGLFISGACIHLLLKKQWLWKGIALAILAVLLIKNVQSYYQSYERRAYTLKNANAYLAAHDLANTKVIGPWSNALTWESKSISFPIWNDFLTTDNPIGSFEPRIIISEPEEEDSGNAYKNLGIDLAAISDSVREMTIAYWKVNIYWLKADSVQHYKSKLNKKAS